MRLKMFVVLLLLIFIVTFCRFDKILQPSVAAPGEVISIRVTISDDLVPEPNAHKGLLCVLIPEDWSFVSADYSGQLGSGVLLENSAWADSAEFYYPANTFSKGMKWLALLSDTGYAYSSPIVFEANVQLKVGSKEGCYDLAYLVTKATPNLIGSSWTPLSYPHRIGVPDSCGSSDMLKAEKAQDWDELFKRTSGWTGSDACYSIPLSGIEVPKFNSNGGKNLFVFGDTFIGDVNENGSRSNTRLVNNTYAVLNGYEPLSQKISFYWAKDNSGNAATVFIPELEGVPDDHWYWPMDGVVVGDSVYLYTLRVRYNSSISFFEPVGVSLISFYLNEDGTFDSYQQKDTPLFFEDDRGNVVLGQAVMPLTEASGNPNADGYLYIYGPRSGSSKKYLLAARVLPEDISNFTKYEYWNGIEWSSDVQDLADLTGFISQEFSVTPLSDGRVLLVFQRNEQVSVRFGESPVGPFDIFQNVYQMPEPEENDNAYVYNAKAHPNLSEPGKLLISYNVNTTSFSEHFSNADIYRPRFIRLAVDDFRAVQLDVTSDIQLLQNYPNPFNGTTTIKYAITEESHVQVKIYDVLGRVVKNLVNNYQLADFYEIEWNGLSDSGQQLASGLYICQIKTKSSQQSIKILLVK